MIMLDMRMKIYPFNLHRKETWFGGLDNCLKHIHNALMYPRKKGMCNTLCYPVFLNSHNIITSTDHMYDFQTYVSLAPSTWSKHSKVTSQ